MEIFFLIVCTFVFVFLLVRIYRQGKEQDAILKRLAAQHLRAVNSSFSGKSDRSSVKFADTIPMPVRPELSLRDRIEFIEMMSMVSAHNAWIRKKKG